MKDSAKVAAASVWPNADYVPQFTHVQPPAEIKTAGDVADYLAVEMAEQLDVIGQMAHYGVQSKVISNIASSLNSAALCLAAFMRTGSLPEMDDFTPHYAREILHAHKELVAKGGCEDIASALLRTLEHALRNEADDAGGRVL